MPIGVNEWRAGIANYKSCIVRNALYNPPIVEMALSISLCLAYLYLFIWTTVITAPFCIFIVWFWSCGTPVDTASLDFIFVLAHANVFVLKVLYLMISRLMDLAITRTNTFLTSRLYRKKVLKTLQGIMYAFLIGSTLECCSFGRNYPFNLLLLLSGDIHKNPGPITRKDLKFFHWNLNSLCARDGIKKQLIEVYDAVHKYDVIAVSESMLDSTIKNDDISIEGFSKDIYRSDHPSNTKIGGVCLYYRDELPIERRTDLELLQEMIVTEISLRRKKIILATLYRSPSQNSEQFETFINNLQRFFSDLRNENPNCIILTGDFNCRSSQWWSDDEDTPQGTALDELMETNNVYQLIDEPTNIRTQGMSCIDLIVTDQPNMFVDYGVHPSLDPHCEHQIVFGKINVSVPSPPPYKRTIWDYSKANVPLIRSCVNNTDWQDLLSGLNPGEMAAQFTDTLLTILSLHIPNKIIKINDKDAPWITPELKSAIKRKHRVFRKYVIRGRNQEDWKTVKEIQAENSKKIFDAKNSYYLKLGKKLSDPRIGIKEYWSVLNRMIQKKKFSNIPPLLENGLFVTNIDTKANIFNDYFVKQCCAITTGSTLPSFLPRSAPRLHSLVIDRGKVLRIIHALDSKKAHGCDDISISMIKMCDTSIVEPLCLIFEKCLETGVYPFIWKKANVIPVHKKNSRQSKENYRPISLLPLFGKIFEKLIFDSMYEHFCNHGLITPNQSGFRPNDSAINQLLSITHQIYCAFEANPSKETRAVFLDLSKAFDRVWHEGLIYKLECKGISGNLLNLVKNYLKDRKQRVVLNGRSSEWAAVSAGVPQGSVLGPLFFLIYIDDLTENVAAGVKLFADDTSLFSVVENENETALKLNSDLEKLRTWAWQWKMKFNADKTEEVLFSCKRNKPAHPTLRLGSSDIIAKIEHKHLGMILDSKLDFQSHVNEAIVKARRGIGMIKYLSRYVSREVLDMIYKLHVRPHLDYGDIIYHKFDPDMRLAFTQKLERTQYLAALAVTGTWRGTNRQRLFNELGWETLYDRRWYRRLCHFFSLIKSKSPEYLYSELPQERQLQYSLRNPFCFEQPVSRTARFASTYFHNTLFEWNLLDDETRNSKSLLHFKNKLLAIVRPIRNSTYKICDISGVKLLTKLRVQFSPLNEHRFKHAFDCLSPVCFCGKDNENNKHFLLHCPLYDVLRRDLFDQLSDVPGLDIASINNIDDDTLCDRLLFGNPSLGTIENRVILDATISFLKNSGRLD